jgi:hypothetical protein
MAQKVDTCRLQRNCLVDLLVAWRYLTNPFIENWMAVVGIQYCPTVRKAVSG